VLPDAVEAALAIGDVAAAQAGAQALSECTVTTPHPWADAAAARCKALIALAGGAVEDALSDLLVARERFESIGHALDWARVTFDLGRAELEARRRSRAATLFAEAGEAFERAGATAWAFRARDAAESANPGLTPSRLTPSEERIAALVLGGHSNKEIASRLRTTVAAVEAHLSRAYRKLGIRSRAQLIGVLATGLAEPRMAQ
jgi:DNA-binding CsgD family transcriptional regulator